MLEILLSVHPQWTAVITHDMRQMQSGGEASPPHRPAAKTWGKSKVQGIRPRECL